MTLSLQKQYAFALLIALAAWSCKNQTGESSGLETYSHPETDSETIKNAELFIKASFRDISKIFEEAIDESDFHAKYRAFSRGCDLDFHIAHKRSYSSFAYYNVDVRAKLRHQDKDDRSNLGLRSLSVAIPTKFRASSHRYPGSSHYSKVTNFQASLSAFMYSVVRKNRNCLKAIEPTQGG